MSSVMYTSNDSDTERACCTPSSDSSSLSQRDQNSDHMANTAPGSTGHTTTLGGPGADMSRNEDIEMATEPSMDLESIMTEAALGKYRKASFPEGDLMLVVGSNKIRTFKTISSLLASTSPVWKDRVALVKNQGSRSLRLPNDDPKTMLLFLKIIHLLFSELPKKIPFDQLYSLTRFCDRYQVRHLFLPFVPRWFAPFIRDNLNPERTEWIFIAAVWDIDYMLNSWLSHVSWNARKDINGDLSYGGRKVADLLPDYCRDDILHEVAWKRVVALQELTRACEDVLRGNCCLEESHEEQCHMLTTGYLLTGLERLGGWPVDPNTTCLCPEDVRSTILNLLYEPLPIVVENEGEEDHSFCGVYKLKCEVSAVNRHMCYILPKDSTIGSAFAPYLPFWRRSGFCERDFESTDLDGKDDPRYRQPHRENTEPREEYESDMDTEDENSDESSDSGLDSESSSGSGSSFLSDSSVEDSDW
ncbi:hypothetical protein DTO021D3_2667 [Paecilomyces variotii]|nr:hypothetical protein DTO032I3_4524 [Paecilomyces variotii]KAJ9280447.1 hypothetical protein DTO021D3_2667 [Paecilomyces variotii]KAJ9346917.1 hypothetical protein DTO027B6_484 [Paecilomyces variotii]KAJ9393520.1 hypothetical protein DTO032I4_291 [Paecilomyces variotii]